MKVSVSNISETRKAIEVEVERERVDEFYEKTLAKTAKSVQIPGFRKGKAPRGVVERYIDKDLLMQDALKELIPITYDESLKQEKIFPMSDPNLEEYKLDDGKPLVYRISFDVKPQIEIKDYKGIEIEQEKAEITDKDVDDMLESFRKASARLVNVTENRGLQIGDLAIVDFESSSEGKPIKNGTAKNFLMELDTEKFLPGFLENVKNMKREEVKEFDVDFPADYPGEMAGKKVHFKFQVKEIKIKVLPEPNDDFAKEVSKFKTLEELRADLRKQLENRIKELTRGQLEAKILEKLLPQVTTAIPQSFVNYEINYLVNDILKQLHQRGMSIADYLKAKNQTEAQFLEELKPTAERLAKVELIIDAVSKNEMILVSDHEINKEIEEFSSGSKQDPAKVRSTMEKEGTLYNLGYHLLKHKVMDFLINNAKVAYVAPAASAPAATK
ncbi:MAG: trigger factor [Firmicutes bacterium]|nr:trigger factor [Bacillota bacterium]